jgi:hypothetical protein
VQADLTTDRWSEAINNRNTVAPLKEWLIPQVARLGEVSGRIEREIEIFGLRLQVGLSDTWNLALEGSRVRITQTSTLATTSSDEDIAGQVERLRSRTVSGAGDTRLTSLHRTHYSDRHSIVLGFGVALAGSGPELPYEGRGTLMTGDPASYARGQFQYTFYPFIDRGRFEFAAALDVHQDAEVKGLDGQNHTLEPGQRADFRIGWEQELGPVLLGFAFTHLLQGQASLDGIRQGDGIVETTGRLVLGFGNLVALEEKPLAFPYLVQLRYDTTLQGYNTPLRNELRLSLLTYF